MYTAKYIILVILEFESMKSSQFSYNELSFGLEDAAQSFDGAMMMALLGLIDVAVFIYLNNVSIYTKAAEDHLVKLRQVLGKLRTSRMTLKLSKCKLLLTNLLYLGYKVFAAGIKMDPTKAEEVCGYAVPRSDYEILSFIGYFPIIDGSYRHFQQWQKD